MVSFMALRMILGIPELFRGVPFSQVVTMSLLFGVLGFLPGAIIGFHVDIDD